VSSDSDDDFLHLSGLRIHKVSLLFLFVGTSKMAPSDEKTSWGSGGLFSNRELGSFSLIVFTQVFCVPFILCCKNYGGSITAISQAIMEKGAVQFVTDMWPTPFDPEAWKIILIFMLFEILLMQFVPGKIFRAMPTPTGHIPTYIDNGVACYFISIFALFGLAHYELFDPAIIYDKLDVIVSALNVFALCFCSLLAFKGLTFPSTKDSGSNGSIIMDFFWGTELYPRIFGVDVKQFTNCRFGLMYWQLGIICYAFKQYQILGGHISSSMLISVVLQSVYLFKFYYWETGYFCSMDIQHDRAGYYICWGCLVYVPSLYTIHTYFLVEHPVHLSIPTAVLLMVSGLFCIWCNYDCDRFVRLNVLFILFCIVL
jgi:7-dehydrocholesterol reductase